jgi:hypothetical protein
MLDTKTSAQYFSMTHDGDFFHYLSTLFPATESSEPSDELEHAIQLELSPQEYAFGLAAAEIDTEHADEDMQYFLSKDLERAFSFPEETYDLDYNDEETLDADDYDASDTSFLSPDIPDQIQNFTLHSPLERKAQAATERNDSDNDTIEKDDFCYDHYDDNRPYISPHNPFQTHIPPLYSPIEREQTQNDTDVATSMQEPPEHKQPRPTKKRSLKETASSSPSVFVPKSTWVLLTPFNSPTLSHPIVVASNALGRPSVELPLSAVSTSFYSPGLLQPIAIAPKHVDFKCAETNGRLPLTPASARLNTRVPAMATKWGLGGKEQENGPNYKKKRWAF